MVKLIGVIGDSIAHGFYDEQGAGWFSRLSRMIKQNSKEFCAFNNMAQAGDNIADAYHRALCEVSSRHFNLLLVSLGANDIRRRNNSNSELDFSFGARQMYWQKLLEFLQKTGAKIVVTDLLPVIETRYGEDATLTRKNADVESYNSQIKELCAQYSITFFERYDNWKTKNLEALYQDALHPNSEGHKIIAEEVFAFLQNNHIL